MSSLGDLLSQLMERLVGFQGIAGADHRALAHIESLIETRMMQQETEDRASSGTQSLQQPVQRLWISRIRRLLFDHSVNDSARESNTNHPTAVPQLTAAKEIASDLHLLARSLEHENVCLQSEVSRLLGTIDSVFDKALHKAVTSLLTEDEENRRISGDESV
jgi:hypothetical protein